MKKRHLHHYWEHNNPKSIILHTSLGKGVDNIIGWLDYKGYSYNYLIGEDGETYEMVPVGKSAWHSGVVSNPVPKAKKFYKGNPNKESVGIVFECNGEQELTDEQVEEGKNLIEWLSVQTDITYNADNIFCHVDITDYKPQEVRGYKNQLLNKDYDYKGEQLDKLEKLVALLSIARLRLWITLLQRGR